MFIGSELSAPLAALLERMLVRLSAGAFTPMESTSSAFARFKHCADYIMCMRGRFKRRDKTSPMLWASCALHITVVLGVIAYPFFAPRTYDGCYLLFVAAVVTHWLLLKGECVLSLIEKKLAYEEYRMGAAPLHQWWCDRMPLEWAVVIIWVMIIGWNAAATLVVLRNVQLQDGRVGFVLRYGARVAFEAFLDFRERVFQAKIVA